MCLPSPPRSAYPFYEHPMERNPEMTNADSDSFSKESKDDGTE